MHSYLLRLIHLGIEEHERSFGIAKNIKMLNRIILISILSLVIYSIVMFAIGFFLSGLFCALSIPILSFNLYLIHIGRRKSGKYLYTIWLLGIITLFSVYFGTGIASEYWVLLMGGMSLLIFRQRQNSLLLVFITILCFGLIQLAQYYIEPVVWVDEAIQSYIFTLNIIFIFISAFIISYILRYSSEDFERIIHENRRVLQNQNKDMTDSIKYASRIQNAILPSAQLIEKHKDNFFILFEPKDIVSGDFYWIYPLKDRVLFAIVDGAGHGVTGALTSIMSHTLLTQSVEEYNKIEPIDIYNQMKELINVRKEKWNDFLIEDLELSICSYKWDDFQLKYASNGNFLYLVKHVNNVDDLDEITFAVTDRYVLKEVRNAYEFNEIPRLRKDPVENQFTFRKDDMLYLTTNGMARQLGGPKYKKLKAKRLKDLLMSVQHFNVKKQEHIIRDVLLNWRGKLEGTDDVTIMGFKI